MSKYNAKKITIDGYLFDSLMESRRYENLKLMVVSGDIESLEIHPVFPLVVNDKRIGKYIADFQYTENGKQIIEDVKGFKTSLYRLKKRLVEALYGVEILETHE